MENKKFFLSLGFWGGFMVVASPVLNALFGTSIDTALQAEIADKLFEWTQVISGTLAVYGRVRATKKLTL